MTIEEKVEIKILKAVLGKSELQYVKNALDYINILENRLNTSKYSQQRELLIEFLKTWMKKTDCLPMHQMDLDIIDEYLTNQTKEN